MPAVENICRVLKILSTPSALHALATWPLFSFTSYFIVRSLATQHIIPKTVIDVGANVGQFAVASAKLFPGVRVHSFEPHPQCFRKLQQNTTRVPNASAYQLALGDKEADVQFHINAHSHSSSILPVAAAHVRAFPHAVPREVIPVRMSTLDRYFAAVELGGPALLKLDVQGYEKSVLDGARHTLERIEYVVMETSFKRMYEGETLFMELVNTMAARGFSFARPLAMLTDSKTGEHIQMDSLFIRN